jgi:hypothetical protein
MERNAHVQPLMADILNLFSPDVPQTIRERIADEFRAGLDSVDDDADEEVAA